MEIIIRHFILQYLIVIKKIFFAEFPSECVEYDGENPIECYYSLWESVGCEEEGFGRPQFLDEQNIAFLNDLNLRYVLVLLKQ